MAHALPVAHADSDAVELTEKPSTFKGKPVRGASKAEGSRVTLSNGVEVYLPPILEGKAALAFAKRRGILTAKGNFTKRFR